MARTKTNKPSGKAIYDELRRQILTLELAPGSALDEFSLADVFGVSRSPVRHAVARLSAEGLVRTVGNRSMVSRLMDYKAFPQYVDALALIQRAITRMAAQRAGDADIQAIRQTNAVYLEALGSGDLRGMTEANKAFHLAIADTAGNEFMTRHYAHLLDEGQRLMHVEFDFVTGELGHQLGDDHEALITAIANHDADAAERAAHEHAVLFRDRFLDYLKQLHAHEIAVEFQTAIEGTDYE